MQALGFFFILHRLHSLHYHAASWELVFGIPRFFRTSGFADFFATPVGGAGRCKTRRCTAILVHTSTFENRVSVLDGDFDR